MRRPADGDAARPDLPRHPDAVCGVELVCLRNRKILCSNDDRAADGMLRSLLHRCGESGDLVCRDACRGVHAVDAHLARRHGAGLVQHDGVDASGLLEHLGARQQDSQLRTTSGADHQRGRCRESERTGARDDQDRNRRGERCQHRTVDPPEDQCAKGNEHDGGNKDAGDPVGESLDLGLTRLRCLDHPGHLRQRGIGTDVGRTNHEPTARVDRRTDDVVVDGHLDGHGFACEHGHVDSGDTFDDNSVGSDLLARTDDELVSDGEVSDRDPHLTARTSDHDVLRTEIHERPKRVARTDFGAFLRIASREDEGRDACRSLEIDERRSRSALGEKLESVCHARHSGHAEEQGVQRPSECGESAHRHQRVHGRSAVPQVAPRGEVERIAAPNDHGRSKSQRQPLPVGELPCGHHCENDDRYRQQRRDDESLTQTPQLDGSGTRIDRRNPGPLDQS